MLLSVSFILFRIRCD